MTKKQCPGCGETKPPDAFQMNRTGTRGYGGYCLSCHNRITRENRVKNHGSTRNYHLVARYGLTADEVKEMVAAQGGTCAICRVRPAEHVDHDHETGEVRGVLCFTCNVGLGNFGDDPHRLLLAQRYLTRSRATVDTAARLRLTTRRAS
ncbi:MAG TPA: endonuclease VII domain-containing protein [Frankiaceae bacterium]|nr:endonuclease VII domain-containing protein [Frankiaceae bacterium]